MKKTSLYFLLLFIGFVAAISCEKKEAEKGEEENTELIEKKERAAFNSKQMSGVGNVFVANALEAGSSQQLYAKADYKSGYFAYYISPRSATDIGVDHRLVFSGNKEDQCVVEMDEEKQVLHLYGERQGKRLPIILKISQHSLREFEYRLYRIDWNKKAEELVGSVYLRDGKPVGVYRLAARVARTGADTTAKDVLGFPGVSRPARQSTVAATTEVFLGYIHSVLGPLVDLQNKGMGRLSGDIEESSVTAYAFGALWQDMQVLSPVLAEAGAVFGSFRTDPLIKDDPLSGFSWYSGQSHAVVNLNNMQLTPILKNSTLIYDETDMATQLQLVLQVEDKNGKPLTGNPVFIDFKVGLEQEGKTYILSEQTLSSDKEKGTVQFLYNPHQAVVKPKAGGKLYMLYRFSANEGAVFAKQEASIADREPAHISIVSGAGQVADWEEKLQQPLVVKVTNSAGQPLKNIGVNWTVQSTSWGIIVGKLSETQVQTDEQGLARTYYTVGKQQEKAETVRVQVIGVNGQPVPTVETLFTYKQKRRNFTLVQLRHQTDGFDVDKTSVIREWKNGDPITIMENELLTFHIKEDGRLLIASDGKLAHFIHSTKSIALTSKYANRTFQSKDIILKNWGITFSDPVTGRTDSVVVDLTISNQLYRTFVGKTVRAVGGGNTVDGNKDEVLTFNYRTDGRVEIKSLKYPTTNVVTTFETAHNFSYVPIYGCPDKNGIIPYTMKRLVGQISSPVGPSMMYGMNTSFLLFDDGSIKPNTMGSGFDACTFSRFWSSVQLQ